MLQHLWESEQHMYLKDLEGLRVGVCVSGGLDSKTVTKRLLDAGVDVLCFFRRFSPA